MQTDNTVGANESAAVAGGSFDALKARLDEIVELVSDDSMPLEEALSLYEEAVGLGLKASNMLEADIALSNAAIDSAEEQAAQKEGSDLTDPVIEAAQEPASE